MRLDAQSLKGKLIPVHKSTILIYLSVRDQSIYHVIYIQVNNNNKKR